MALSWTEIRGNAIAFVAEFIDDTQERPEAQTFWNEFFKIFGLNRRRKAVFEQSVKLLEGRRGKIDLFWKGTLLVEHKSSGEDLDGAYTQALGYFDGIKDKDLPKYVLVSDFKRFRLYDLDEDVRNDFTLLELPDRIQHFGFILGQTSRRYEDAPPINLKAAELMAKLHDALRENGYIGHQLEVFLVRIMFCLFADYTGIFEPRNHFRYYIENKTRDDGSDCGMHIREIFVQLDIEPSRRPRKLDEDLAAFPYVNGNLFKEHVDSSPSFDRGSRDLLLECCGFDWSTVSPAIFGSLFQRVMKEDREDRRKVFGAHYTSEKNILKVLRPLLLDGLRVEFERSTTERQLKDLLAKIAKVKILDPACGCGNFLIIAYRELRQLEIDVHKKLKALTGKHGEQLLHIDFNSGIDVDAMFGIEIEEFPTRIAETALHLVDHQMNVRASLEFGQYFTRLPLRKAPGIRHGNALELDWGDVVKKEELTCIVGNPPFVSKQNRSAQQRGDMARTFGSNGGHGELDFVTCWFLKAARFIQRTTIKSAFVATNSISQGEQVAILWGTMLREGVQIHFAHRTFRWTNDAPGVAHVFCVIVGFSMESPPRRLIFDYLTPDAEPIEIRASNINPYLVDAPDVLISKRRRPICDVPPIRFGSMPNDKGCLLMTEEERRELVSKEPGAARYIRPIVGSTEYINGTPRYCLWLVGSAPSELRSLPLVRARVEGVKKHRRQSERPETNRLADTPSLFGEIRQPANDYIVIPGASSENRRYIPIGFLARQVIASNLVATIDSGDFYILGILTSSMHMAWVRAVCGRLKSDYRYSNEIVYNNFPWPEKIKDARKEAVRTCAREVLRVRSLYQGHSLADLYDPASMPPDLTKAHRALDRAADSCYRVQRFESDASRQKVLFELHEKYVNAGQQQLLPPRTKGRRKNSG